MIKNPKIGQIVFFFEDCEIKSGEVNCLFEKQIHKVEGKICYKYPPAVEITYWYHRTVNKIFPTKQYVENALPKEISETLKTLNKEIASLSKKRENLASKLAKLLKKG